METTGLLFPLKLNSHNDLLENLTKKKKKKSELGKKICEEDAPGLLPWRCRRLSLSVEEEPAPNRVASSET